MYLVRIWTTVSLLAASMPLAASEAPATSLAHIGKWEINYDVDSCHLYGQFRTGADAVILTISQMQPGDSFEIKLIGQMFKGSPVETPIQLAFGAGAKMATYQGLSMIAGESKKLAVVSITGLRIDGSIALPGVKQLQPEAMPEIEAMVTSITFKPHGGERYRLETGSMAKPMAALRACTTDLVQTWGYDPQIQAQLSKSATPIGNPGTWLTSVDFPKRSLSQGQSGQVDFRLDVDASGQISGCRVLYRTNPDDFSDLTCKLLQKRAKMMPALDVQGHPVKSYYVNRVVWLTPSTPGF